MDKILISSILALVLSANSINIDFGSQVKHLVNGNFIEGSRNNLYGVSYSYKDKIVANYSQFINSYGDKTKFMTVNYQVLPFEWNKIKAGVGIGGGYQIGYCGGAFTKHKCVDGDKNKGIIAIPYGLVEFDNFQIKYIENPNVVRIITFGFKACEW